MARWDDRAAAAAAAERAARLKFPKEGSNTFPGFQVKVCLGSIP